jgi:deoxyhypusine synthase
LTQFILGNFKNFNARATRDALITYWRHVDGGGKMFWAVAGAMSSAQLGITLAPAIRACLIHGMSVTGRKWDATSTVASTLSFGPTVSFGLERRF